MPHRLPGAAESRVLLALYHKGPLTRMQLVNLEAMSIGAAHALLALVEKTLVIGRHGPQGPYDLTPAGHDLTQLCLKYDLMVETNYRSDSASRQVNRHSEVLRDFLEGDFHEIRPTSKPAAPKASPPQSPAQVTLGGVLQTDPGSPPAPYTEAPVHNASPAPPVKPVAKRIVVPPPRIYSSRK